MPDVVRYVNFIKFARESFKLSLFRFPDKEELLNFIIFSYRWFLFLIYFLTKAPFLSSFWNFLQSPTGPHYCLLSHPRFVRNLILSFSFAPTYPHAVSCKYTSPPGIWHDQLFHFFENDYIFSMHTLLGFLFSFSVTKETLRCHSSFKKLYSYN